MRLVSYSGGACFENMGGKDAVFPADALNYGYASSRQTNSQRICVCV